MTSVDQTLSPAPDVISTLVERPEGVARTRNDISVGTESNDLNAPGCCPDLEDVWSGPVDLSQAPGAHTDEAVDRMAQAPVGIKPYALVPEDASVREVQRYRANFATALRDRMNTRPLGAMERLVKQELAIYLASHYDPRPLGEITENLRSVLTGRLGRR